MNKIDNIPPFYFWHNSYLEIEPIFVPFHQKKATAAPPDESDNESNDSSILSDSELSSNDNVVQDGVSMQHQDEPLLFDDIKPGIWVTVIYEEKNCLAKVQRKSTDAPTQLINVPCLEKPLGINTFKTSRSHVLMQKKSTGLKSDRIKHKLMRMEKRQESGYGNIEIYCTDSFVKSHQKLQSRTCQNKVEQKWQWQEFGKTKQLF